MGFDRLPQEMMMSTVHRCLQVKDLYWATVYSIQTNIRGANPHIISPANCKHQGYEITISIELLDDRCRHK